MRVLAEFRRDTARSVHGFPQANMFDQPEFEALLRTNLKRYPCAELRGDVEVTDVADDRRRPDPGDLRRSGRRVGACCRGELRARLRRRQQRRARAHRRRHADLKFDQRWLVVDIATTDADLDQWDGVHQVCDPVRAGTYMRIGAHPLPLGVPAAAR